MNLKLIVQNILNLSISNFVIKILKLFGHRIYYKVYMNKSDNICNRLIFKQNLVLGMEVCQKTDLLQCRE